MGPGFPVSLRYAYHERPAGLPARVEPHRMKTNTNTAIANPVKPMA